MKTIFRILTLILVILLQAVALPAQQGTVTYRRGNLGLDWDLTRDLASLRQLNPAERIWSGSLMPAFWLQNGNQKIYIKTKLIEINQTARGVWNLSVSVGAFGKGYMKIVEEPWGINMAELGIDWSGVKPAIIEMYFGTSASDTSGELVWPTWDRPFMPDWSAFGFCVPGAKGGTPQSYFRMWDFGQANIALGSFGPSMGTPYGAAFPRPLLYAGMGSDKGFVALGAGSIPDAALSLNIKATRGCLQYSYREDLWGSPAGNHRVWKNLLRLCPGENAWDAFRNYTASFAPAPDKAQIPGWPIWNTWGMWRQQKYAIPPIADFASQLKNAVLVLDDPWEISQGAGKPDLKKFPHFFEDIDNIHQHGLNHGIWETVGWVSDPASLGLGPEDLLLGKNGKPCKSNWSFNPEDKSFYCLDISSEKTRAFLRERTINTIKTIHPKMIKLDFGYGLPDPNMAAPRNPEYRGERQSYELFSVIRDAARSVDPQVAIMGYSLSPLWAPLLDIISLDDQGDLWYDVPQGHQEWSIWASLLGNQLVSINGSSGYDWTLDDEVLLNTCILGAPGSVLPSVMDDGSPVPLQYQNRRLAVNQWFRKAGSWQPIWLNSQTGNFSKRPRLNAWARQELIGKDSLLTAIALRDSTGISRIPGWSQLGWTGQWALISQDNKDIRRSDNLAIIPFIPGKLRFPYSAKPAKITVTGLEGTHEYRGWSWVNGVLELDCPKNEFDATAGYIVTK